MDIKIAGVVVLYNCDKTIIQNVSSYIDFIDRIYIIDNSENPNKEIIQELLYNYPNDKIVYVVNNDNLGIAMALNQAAQKAIDDNFTWLLTMDQDSYFEEDQIKHLFNSFEYISNLNEIAVITCNYKNPKSKHINKNSSEPKDLYKYKETLIGITSGNLLNLRAYLNIGKFEEKLFIDCVDHDYYLKSISKGYKVICYNNIFLNHTIGKTNKALFSIKIKTHPPLRIYYLTRNSLYLFTKYFKSFPVFISSRFFRLLVTLFRNILFDEKKTEKIKNIFKGVQDFLNNSYGKN